MKLLLIALVIMNVQAFGATNKDLERKVDILADEIAQLKASQKHMGTGKEAHGLGQSASKVYFLNSGLSIGGYGEITYNNQSHENEDKTATDRKPKTEAMRNVIYLGYKYNDQWVLNTEVEIEHVNEVFTEFMYIDNLASEELSYRFGLSLIPMGLTNELHEPIYFNSVNRPEVEKYLIPTTWREIGLGAFGKLGQFSYNAFVFNGPDADSIASGISDGIRKGRKKGGAHDGTSTDKAAKQDASTYAIVLNAEYDLNTATSIGGSIYRGEGSSATQSPMEINIAEVHGTFKENSLGVKFMYALVDFTNAKKWNEVSISDVPNSMDGYYIELDYDFECKKGAILTPFIRFEAYDLTKSVDSNTFGSRNKGRNRTNQVFGVAYKPVDRVIFKADYSKKHRDDDTGVDELNLGIGFVY
jgi:hypothetical protein